ncbi:MAG: DUF3343 domain-containing protein [Candidatus Dadabacteria bacterium]|nr:MAG: DUF3343 domain-containing protein [Candidatus Dadabacteria bacterium]
MSPAFDRLLTFSTTFRVVAAERALRQAGIRCGLAPTPGGVHSACGLSLRLHQADFEQALKAVEAAGLPIEGRWIADGAAWRAVTTSDETPD